MNSHFTNEVILSHGSVNFPESKIFLYNIWAIKNNSSYLTTISVLPDITSGKINWDTLDHIPSNYQLVDIRKIAISSIERYYQTCEKIALRENNMPLKNLSYTPIVKKGDKYLVALVNPCLTEFYRYFSTEAPFALDDYNYVDLYPNGTPYTKADIAKIRNYLNSNFNGDIHYLGKILPYGKQELLKDKKEYNFWITPPSILDAGWQYYGIEEFSLIPNIGIVAGSFAKYLNGGTGSTINSKISKFERNTKMFTALTINDIPFAKYIAK